MKKLFHTILATGLILSSISGAFAQETTTAILPQDPAYTATLGTVDPSPWEFTYKDGVITNYTGTATNINLPSEIYGEPVTTIGALNAVHLTGVTIPSSVTKIDEKAFYGSGLTSIFIPSTVTELGKSVFENCTSLVTASVPSTVKQLPLGLFSGCSSLSSVTLNEGIEKINGSYNLGVFRDCTSLTSITLPNSLTSMGTQTFVGCTALESIIIPPLITEIPNYVFSGCTGLKEITLNMSITTIGTEAFKNCSSLGSIFLPDSLLTINTSAFAGCSSLSAVRMSNALDTLAVNAFQNCVKLTSIYIPPTLTTNHAAFSGCGGSPFLIYGIYGTKAEELANVSNTQFVVGSDPHWMLTTESSQKDATPSTAKVMVNGKAVNFGAYTIEGFNYFKLTDMAYAIDGTPKQFQVTWDAGRSAINMITGLPHITLGTEMQGTTGKTELAERFTSTVYKNGEAINVVVYTIDGSSYFQLDTLKGELDLTVGWDGATGTITINC